ncbi:WD repeat-containing protein 78 [Liparis tanakae]|uniref:Dynein axonemal intermediate chain 4 n=1 Tax=Liparis tanakae TaxID=230148 RepID=A0A4Z2EEZ4_9TELE|nr:WD repeat-containing protein 78 [Liparis tanakae]
MPGAYWLQLLDSLSSETGRWVLVRDVTVLCLLSDLMKLKKVQSTKKKAGGTQTDGVLSALTPGLCLDFHPTDSSVYLVGTWDGRVHRGSCSNSQQLVGTYRKHFCPVNGVAWSPFSPDVFLSCSSDWTVQLWQTDLQQPALSFSSTQTAVRHVLWSPRLEPVLVQPAALGVAMTSLLFSRETDCVLVGDSEGQVEVYQLQNLRVGPGSQVDVLENIVRSAAT